MQAGNLYIDYIENKGRGVRTLRAFEVDEVIEVCPVVVLPPRDREHLDKTDLFNYYFEWGKTNEESAIAFGYGSMYNHDARSNAVYEMDFEARTLTIVAIRPIAAGEEITVNYMGEADNTEKVWFE